MSEIKCWVCERTLLEADAEHHIGVGYSCRDSHECHRCIRDELTRLRAENERLSGTIAELIAEAYGVRDGVVDGCSVVEAIQQMRRLHESLAENYADQCKYCGGPRTMK